MRIEHSSGLGAAETLRTVVLAFLVLRGMMGDYGVLLRTNIPGFPIPCFWLMWSNRCYTPLAVPLVGQ